MALHAAGAVREKKQSMAELKLRRLTELNARLREDLDRPRIKVSDACQSLVAPPATRFFLTPLSFPFRFLFFSLFPLFPPFSPLFPIY